MPASNPSDSERTLLVDGLEELELRASPAQLDALLALARLLETWSQRINLTGDRTLHAILRHRVLGAAVLIGSLLFLALAIRASRGATQTVQVFQGRESERAGANAVSRETDATLS